MREISFSDFIFLNDELIWMLPPIEPLPCRELFPPEINMICSELSILIEEKSIIPLANEFIGISFHKIIE